MLQMHYEAWGLCYWLTSMQMSFKIARWSKSQSKRVLLTKQLFSVFHKEIARIHSTFFERSCHRGHLGKGHEIPHDGGWPWWLQLSSNSHWLQYVLLHVFPSHYLMPIHPVDLRGNDGHHLDSSISHCPLLSPIEFTPYLLLSSHFLWLRSRKSFAWLVAEAYSLVSLTPTCNTFTLINKRFYPFQGSRCMCPSSSGHSVGWILFHISVHSTQPAFHNPFWDRVHFSAAGYGPMEPNRDQVPRIQSLVSVTTTGLKTHFDKSLLW